MEISIKHLGHIYRHEPKSDWAITHAQVPFLFKVNDKEYRVYYSTRDSKSRSSVTFVSLDVQTLTPHESRANAPLLTRGKPGAFDDSGLCLHGSLNTTMNFGCTTQPGIRAQMPPIVYRLV